MHPAHPADRRTAHPADHRTARPADRRTARPTDRRSSLQVIDRRTVLRATGGLLVAGGLAGCNATAGPEGEESAATDDGDDPVVVEVGPDQQYVFRPGTDEPLRVEADATVEFVWRSDAHNVAVEETPDGAGWTGHEAIEDEGFSFSHTFTVPGRYEYYCTPHESLGMTGTVLVE